MVHDWSSPKYLLCHFDVTGVAAGIWDLCSTFVITNEVFKLLSIEAEVALSSAQRSPCALARRWCQTAESPPAALELESPCQDTHTVT